MRACLSGSLLAAGLAFVACGGEEFSSTGTGGAPTGGAGGGGGAAGSGGTSAGGSGGVAASGGVAGSGAAGATGGAAGTGGTSPDGGCPDADKDGTTTCAGDCDDTDPAVSPTAKEICGDAKDNDCNGGADNGCNGLGSFVSEQVGSDSNPGTMAQPLKTVMKGVANADAIRKGMGTPAAKIEVFIAEGDYVEKVKLLEGVSLLGGYQCDSSSCSWKVDATKYTSTLQAIDYEGTLADQTITRATRLEGLTLLGKSGSPPSGSFGNAALMLDGGRPTIMGCKIQAPDGGGSWPQGHSSAIFIAWSADANGPLIQSNTILGGQSTYAIAIALQNRPGQSKTGAAEIRGNVISGGTGTDSAAGIAFSNSTANTLIENNDINAGTSQNAWAYGMAGSGTATIDRNRINLPGTVAKCSGSNGKCGGIGCESCSGKITNNVVFGADAPFSVALHLAESEKPAGNVVVHSNYLNGGGSNSGGGKSYAIALEIGDCTTCGFKGKTGRIRGNILSFGHAQTRCGAIELASVGRQMHPEALEFNWFDTSATGPTPCLYSFFNGSVVTPLGSITLMESTLVTAGASAKNNQSGDPLVDPANKFHLKAGSPCVNKSTNNEGPLKDMDGQGRPMGAAYDIGPDEAQ